MRVALWAAFGASATLLACRGGLAPVGGGNDGGGGAEASPSSSGSSGGSGSSSGFTGSSSGSGSSSGGSVIDAAFACANGVQPPTTGRAACDQCIDSSCGDSLCICAGDSPDDAGMRAGCLGFMYCALNCLPGTDAGVAVCTQICGPSHTMQQQQEGANLLACIANSCIMPSNTACPFPFGFR
jgi:hypothetical protein